MRISVSSYIWKFFVENLKMWNSKKRFNSSDRFQNTDLFQNQNRILWFITGEELD